MQRDILVENRPSEPLQLDAAETATLKRLGRSLASDKRWWGSNSAEPTSTSAIELWHTPNGVRVTVNNAVGVIGTGRRTIAVQPKIPVDHFLYLAHHGGLAARTETPQTSVGTDTDIWGIVASWYCSALRQLLRRDLAKDYRTTVDDLNVVRGRTDLLATSRSITRGRLMIRSEYTECDADTPLNRVLKAAVTRIAHSVALERPLRREARRLASVFDDVSNLQHGDLAADTDRRTANYQDSIALARLILANQDLDLGGHGTRGQTVLIRTPDLVESGVRQLLTRELGPSMRVTKRGITLRPTSLTLTPDLVFNDGNAIGDIKYQLSTTGWTRSHLYQATTFATGFRATKALVVAFGPHSAPPTVIIGDVTLYSAVWNTSVSPQESVRTLANRTTECLLDSVSGARSFWEGM